MDRRAFLRRVAGTAAVPATGLAGCVSDDGASTTPSETPLSGTPRSPCSDGSHLANGSFECGTYGWAVGRDLPTDPNTGEPVASRVAGTNHGRDPPPGVPAASDGDHALELFLDGRQDDGTLWVQQPADLSGCETLSVDVYSADESFNTITKLAVYAGPDRELVEGDFDTSRAIESAAGWRTETYDVAHDGEGLVAVGISVVWETEVRRYLDAVGLA